ncbi:MAG: hypothetical protein IT327_18795 [Anaerolineae bacterium]|nr:hypothetical protein [Anaerolineae bacterium]
MDHFHSLEKQAWNLMHAGKYDEAIKLYSRCYTESREPSYLFARGTAYLQAGNYTNALEDIDLYIAQADPKYTADIYFIYQGICYWYLNQPTVILPTWEKGLTAPYTDAAGGVELPALLLYGAERLHDLDYNKLALKLLRKHARRKLHSWPGPIVPFLLGKIDETEMHQHVQATPSEILRSRWQCQADFYHALRGLREGDIDIFRARIKRCAENPYGFHEAEYYLARWEVANNFPEPAFG